MSEKDQNQDGQADGAALSDDDLEQVSGGQPYQPEPPIPPFVGTDYDDTNSPFGHL